jgi:hypothetical protein
MANVTIPPEKEVTIIMGSDVSSDDRVEML